MSRIETVVVDSFPAYDVIKPHTLSPFDLPVFKADDTVGVKAPRGYYKQYSFGSAASYALKNYECPIESYNQTVERNQETHWLNQCAVSLSASKQEKKTIYEINVNDEIIFEGVVFQVKTAPNDNLKLVKIDTVKNMYDQFIAARKAERLNA